MDADIVREVLQRHPAAAFKTKVGNKKELDIVYDANDKYYLQYQGQVEIKQEERSLI